MTDAPPSRYKVIEQDGRLVVIDNGEPLEPLVKHSHDVVTPGKMRTRANKKTLQRPITQKARPNSATGSAIELPLGPNGAMMAVEIDSAVLGKLISSLFAVIVLFFIVGPFLIFAIILAVVIGSGKSGEERVGKKALRAWARWVAGTS